MDFYRPGVLDPLNHMIFIYVWICKFDIILIQLASPTVNLASSPSRLLTFLFTWFLVVYKTPVNVIYGSGFGIWLLVSPSLDLEDKLLLRRCHDILVCRILIKLVVTEVTSYVQGMFMSGFDIVKIILKHAFNSLKSVLIYEKYI